MAKVKIKVSGCFRTRLYAEAWCRISSYLSSMAALGYNPLVAIQIALAGKAAEMIKMHYTQPKHKKGEQLPLKFISVHDDEGLNPAENVCGRGVAEASVVRSLLDF